MTENQLANLEHVARSPTWRVHFTNADGIDDVIPPLDAPGVSPNKAKSLLLRVAKIAPVYGWTNARTQADHMPTRTTSSEPPIQPLVAPAPRTVDPRLEQAIRKLDLDGIDLDLLVNPEDLLSSASDVTPI
jgi:hypothetical protein